MYLEQERRVLSAIAASKGSGSGSGGDASAAKQDTGNASLASIDGKIGGVTETAPATDTASSGLNGRLQRVAQRITSLVALLPAALGGTTSANSLPVVLSSDGPFATQTGSVTETAPATDTASSGLNGRLQRIAQRITSLIALLPTALGANGGLKIEGVASGTVVPISGTVTANNTAATVVVSTALETSKVLKNSAGSLVSLSWLNARTSSQYLLIMNSTTVPVDGAVTLLYPPIFMPATSNGMVEFKNALVASTGISVSNSSTGTFTKTIGSADCIFCAQVI